MSKIAVLCLCKQQVANAQGVTLAGSECVQVSLRIQEVMTLLDNKGLCEPIRGCIKTITCQSIGGNDLPWSISDAI